MTKKKVKIRITKNVYWEDWGTQRLVFKKGWEGWATAYYDENGKFSGVSRESPIYEGVSDTIWEDCYEILEEVGE